MQNKKKATETQMDCFAYFCSSWLHSRELRMRASAGGDEARRKYGENARWKASNMEIWMVCLRLITHADRDESSSVWAEPSLWAGAWAQP